MYRRPLLSGVFAGLLAAGTAAAQAPAPRVAISGYDPVAYFTTGKPARGTPGHTYDWDGTRYQFASAANRALFAANPEKYAPQYTGHCAGTMARGFRAEPDPNIWVIAGGRLFVFSSAGGPARFSGADGADLIRRADANWQASGGK
jgi:YHS domain-containing protein